MLNGTIIKFIAINHFKKESYQCFEHAYLAYFKGRRNMTWALTTYEHYKRLQKQATKKDLYSIHILILALDMQLLALKNLLTEIMPNHIIFIQLNSVFLKNLYQSNKTCEFSNYTHGNLSLTCNKEIMIGQQIHIDMQATKENLHNLY